MPTDLKAPHELPPAALALPRRRALLAGLALGLATCRPKAGAANRLVVGMELDYPPFEMRGKTGAPEGISVEIAGGLAARLQRELLIENIPFSGLIPALTTGKIDLIISSMTITEERGRSIDFSEPYWRTGLGILTYEGSGVQGAEDLLKPEIHTVVKMGTTGHLYAQQKLKGFSVVDRLGVATLEISQKKSQAFLYDQLTLVRTAREMPGLRPILTPIQIEPWGMGLAKGNDRLKSEVNEYLREAKARGNFKAWAEKFLTAELAEARKWGGEIIY